MFQSPSFRKAVATCMALLWIHATLIPSVTLAAAIDVPNGHPIDLAFQGTLTPETAVVGQTVVLNVVQDVVIEGRVVIAQGTIGQGEIVRAQKRGSVGKAAELQVVLRSVAAVDGTNVPLTGQKSVSGEEKQTSSIVVTLLCCILGLLMKGGQAEIPAGSTVRGMVVGPVAVEVAD